MHVVHKSELPFVGMSHQFVGRDQGKTGVSFFLVSTTEPGHRVRLHKHDYDEVVHVIEGQSTWTIGEQQQVIAGAGDTVVVHAGESHGFVNSGQGQLRQIDIHLHPTFETTWLEE
jgi:quercetin dioxygenase-like cupin family protein